VPVRLELAAAREGDDVTGQHLGLPDRVLRVRRAELPGPAQVRHRRDVPGGEHAGNPDDGQVRADLNPTGFIGRQARRRAQRARPHAGRPHQGSGLQLGPVVQPDGALRAGR
jgi:hypothetical protein